MKKGKTETCESCKHREGHRCNKFNEYIELEDWCYAYRRRKK